MSGIVAIFCFDGRQVDRAALERMLNAVAHRGPDDRGLWCQGSVGLGYAALHTTPESLGEKQPLVLADSKLALVFDGRVDNRQELISHFRSEGIVLRSDSDAEIVLRAYELWREEAARRIVGDFAFVLWDGRSRQLICGRDVLGVKPLYFHFDERRFICASEIGALFEDPTTPRIPNEGMVGEYLVDRIVSQQDTLYKDVFRLQPAHCLTVRDRSLVKRRYYDADPTYRVIYRDEQEYAQHFRHLFEQAVACRMRSATGVGCELSGGLDSSSVVCVAQRLLQAKQVSCPLLEAFSGVFPGHPCDESDYIRAVTETTKIRANLFGVPSPPPSRWATEAARYRDFPSYPNGLMNETGLELARRKGFRVMLTGLGGDNWLSGSVRHYSDLLVQFKIAQLFRSLRDELSSRGINLSSPSDIRKLAPFLYQAFSPLIPEPVARILRAVRGKHRLPAFVDPNFARRNSLLERIRGTEIESRMPKFPTYAQMHIYEDFLSGAYTHNLEQVDRMMARWEVEGRHPFNDRRLVEFMLAIPEDERYRNGKTKIVLRQAMKGIIPETVRQRTDKAEFSFLFVRELKACGAEELFSQLAIAAEGWVKQDAVQSLYRATVNSPNEGHNLWLLWRILGIELWFRAEFKDEFTQEFERSGSPSLAKGVEPTTEALYARRIIGGAWRMFAH